MTTVEPDRGQDDDRWADVRARYQDILSDSGKSRWGTVKDRLAIVAVILVLGFLVFLVLDGSFTNFRCTFGEFVTFECNRWAGEEHPSLRSLDRTPPSQ